MRNRRNRVYPPCYNLGYCPCLKSQDEFIDERNMMPMPTYSNDDFYDIIIEE